MFTRKMSAAVTIIIVALVALSLLASALPVFGQPAAALPMHARLVAAAPADGSTVATATEVVLTFSEAVNETFVEVSVDGPAGPEADGDPSVDGTAVTQRLTGDLPAGEHTVTYRVVSVDGHPVSGSVTFSTTQAPASADPEPTPATTAPASAPTAADGTPGWVLPAALITLLALLAGGGTLLARTRRSEHRVPDRQVG